MAGSKSGVVKRLRDIFPLAKYSTHCRAHALNLVIIYACKVPEIGSFMDRLKELTFFINYSPKRKAILKAEMSKNEGDVTSCLGELDEAEVALFKSGILRHNLPSLCETRWLARVDTLSCLLSNYEVVLNALDRICRDSVGQARSDAVSYSNALEGFSFIMSAVVTQSLLAVLRPLSVALQAIDADLLGAHEEAQRLISVIEKFRNSESHYEKLFQRATTIARQIHGDDFIPTMPRIAKRSVYRSNVPSETVQDHFKKNLYLPAMDTAISHLSTRFGPEIKGAMLAVNLLPQRIDKLDDTMMPLFETFKDELVGITWDDFEIEV